MDEARGSDGHHRKIILKRKKMKSKQGKLEIEYIAIIILALLVLVILVIFSDTIRQKIAEGVASFFDEIVRGR